MSTTYRQAMDDVKARVASSRSSFHAGMAILPKARREAMYALYAFCREVDDIADDGATFAERTNGLQTWRERIKSLFNGKTADSITAALAPAVQRFGLIEKDFQDIIDGMAMDAGDPICAPDMKTLDLYCDRVASAVGRASVRIFGDSSAKAMETSYHLGRALQLTNILRDLHEDVARGRLYLPLELLARHGISSRNPAEVLRDLKLPAVCRDLAEQAAQHFAAADAAMRECKAAAMRPARIMRGYYGAILKQLRREDWRDLSARITLPKWKKLGLFYGIWRAENMTNARHVHIVGAGMAGLSAALQLTLSGEKVTLYEAAPFAGGRCRSFFDRELDCRIDNGSHLVLSGNVAIHDYLFLTNALESMGGPGEPIFPFMDLESGERWVARMNMGRMPWWVFDKTRRVAGTRISDYFSMLDILVANEGDTVTSRLRTDTVLFSRFWEPMVIGVLNTEPKIASARLLANVLAQSFAAGGRNCIPLIPKVGLSETFVAPCLNILRQHEVEVKYNYRLRTAAIDGERVHRLNFNDEQIEIAPQDWVIFALPAWVVRDILPGLSLPTEFRSIVNAHFRVEAPNNPAGFTGLVGGLAEWSFVRNGVVSVTVSCAERYRDTPTRNMAGMIWNDMAKLYDLDPEKVPPHRIFKESYATFAATPAQDALRPLPYDFRWRNLAMAGEWTATGLPSTIEGAIRSGVKAAQTVMRWAE